MKLRFASLLVLVLSAPLFGQTNLSSSGAILIGNSGGNLYWSMPTTSWNGIPLETRHRKLGAPTVADLHKTALHITRRDLAPAAYLKLAASIGVPADEAQILEAIEHNSLEVFDYEKVDSYLYNQALKQGAKVRWVWKPAREKDRDKGLGSGESENVGIIYNKLYAKRIPMEVMATIKAVLDCAPDAIPLISDFEVAKPDPFLAITTPRLLEEGKIWIVKVWEEPGFGSAPEPVKTPVIPGVNDLLAQAK